jgi:hypothetical protein
MQCSSCGSVVTIRPNENGEVNCSHCGAGLLELPSMNDADIERYSDQPRGAQKPKRPPRAFFSLLLFILLALAFLAGAAVVGKTILNQ